jgi:Arylsulfotransferase (ASST)/CHU_C Type IX secretion signal domain
MKKTLLLSVVFLYAVSATAQESFMVKTETRYWDNSKTYAGYTMFGTRGVTYLIDFEGHVIHTWNIGTNPRFTGDGLLLDAVGGNPSNQNTWKELDWTGNTIWQYSESRSNYHGHHDFTKIYNPKLGDSTFLYIANKDLTAQQCLDAGCDPQYDYTGAQMDAVVEVNRQGTVIWEWCFFDHVVQDMFPSKSTYGIIANTPGRINLNIRGNHVKSDWMHCNSLDYNQDLDMIVVNSVHGEFYVIDHGNTFIANQPANSIALAAGTLGDFKYRFGDPAKYNQGDPPSVLDNWEKATAGNKQLGGSHDIQWIKPGLPGEGHFLVFDNAQNLFELTPQSYIIEINPYLNAAGVNTGNFVNPPDAGYNTVGSPDPNLMKENKKVSKQIVWKYSSKNNTSFYSTIGSSAQRLPNGNTLVCAMNDGHFFEVHPSDTSVVWEYTNPMTRDGIKKIKVDNYPTYNGVFRAYRYAATDPGLAGHDLTPGNTMTGDPPNYWTPVNVTDVDENTTNPEQGNVLNQNYPNPFSTGTTIEFSIVEPALVSLIIYDLWGNQVKSLVRQNCAGVKYSRYWDGKNDQGSQVESGMYVYILKANNQQLSKKMIYCK